MRTDQQRGSTSPVMQPVYGVVESGTDSPQKIRTCISVLYRSSAEPSDSEIFIDPFSST